MYHKYLLTWASQSHRYTCLIRSVISRMPTSRQQKPNTTSATPVRNGSLPGPRLIWGKSNYPFYCWIHSQKNLYTTLEIPNNGVKKTKMLLSHRIREAPGLGTSNVSYDLEWKNPRENPTRNSKMVSNYNVCIFSWDVIRYKFARLSLSLLSPLLRARLESICFRYTHWLETTWTASVTSPNTAA